MRNSKLYSILEKLDKIEQNRLRKYLQSPYFNADETLVELFETLVAEINGEVNGSLDKEVIWKELDLLRPYDDVRFRKYCSDLLKLVESFLAQELYESDPLQKVAYLMEATGKRKLTKQYNSVQRRAKRLLNKESKRSAEYYYYQYLIEKNYFQMVEAETNRTERANIEEISNNLDYFYFGEKLRIYNFVLSQKHITSHKYNYKFINEIVSHIGANEEYYQIPPVALYYQIHLTYTEPKEDAHYYKLKNLLDRYALFFPENQAKDEMYMSAQNYCIRKINQGNQKFLKELFDLYNDLIEKEIIFVEDEISPWDFRNIVVIALRLGKFDWVEYFIKNYNNKIPYAYRENAVSFNLATLYFYRKDYQKVIQLLQTVEYEDPSYNLNSKAMLLATYFEMDEIEPLYSLFESFRVYLNRKKDIPEDKKRLYKNLIKFTRKLTRIIPGDKKSIEKLKVEIDATRNIASAGWLKEKIAELEG